MRRNECEPACRQLEVAQLLLKIWTQAMSVKSEKACRAKSPTMLVLNQAEATLKLPKRGIQESTAESC